MTAFSKNIIIVIIIILFVIGIHMYVMISFENQIEMICQKSENFINYIHSEEYDKAKNEALEIKKNWNASTRVLSLYIDHVDIGQVGLDIDMMISSFENGNYDEAILEANRIIVTVREIYERARLSLYNIF